MVGGVSEMQRLAPGWVLIDKQYVAALVHGPLGSLQWRDAALIDKHTGAIYVLLPGLRRETVARVLGRADRQGEGE